MFHIVIVEERKAGGVMESLLLPLIADSDVVADIPKPQQIREYVLNQLQHFFL